MRKILIFILIFLLLANGCSRQKSQENKNEKDIILKLSKETQESIGLKTKQAELKKVSFQLKFNGIVKEVPNKTFYVASPVKGRVLEVLVEPNQIVSKGEKLAEISSQDVAELQFNVTKEQIELEGQIEDAMLELSLAESSYERESKLFMDGITAKKDFLEAENKYKRAKHNLEILEKKKESVTELAEKRLSIVGANLNDVSLNKSGHVEVKSPANSIILKRSVNPGEVVDENSTLFEASDLTEVFLESQIYEKDLPEISLGKKVTFTTEACPKNIFHGEINYISQTVEPQTRTVTVRAKIQNPDYKLKPEMFGKMFISQEDKEALVVSKESVQKVDNKDVVYVKAGDGFKEATVKLGKDTDGLVEVLSGLKPNQEVVTEGSFWLKSELHAD